MTDILNNIFNEDFIKLTISNKKHKSNEIKKIQIKEVNNFYQISSYTDTQVFHKNIENDIQKYVEELIEDYKQIDIVTTSQNIKILISKKGKVSVIKKNIETIKESSSHNKKKQYLIEDGTYIHWLYKLDIMDKNGFVKQSKIKKFKQINKFLENIKPLVPTFEDEVNIVDIGCGKSYLTFAVYHYLTELGYNVSILGIDLKEKVINNCQELAQECKFDNLEFVCADIFEYQFKFERVDMLIGLHACDIATDFVLYHGIKLNAAHILSVPCCQHEVKSTIKNNELNYIIRHGIFKDRFSSMLTDSIRALLLEAYGYDVVVAEFIEMQYTAKNVLIKANKKSNKVNEDKIQFVKQQLELYSIDQTLYSLLTKGEI